ncbi:MAG: porin family protein [Gammaproteobacteria bacterium]|nr:porin family protein [Gammaproteobacteria bacterium]
MRIFQEFNDYRKHIQCISLLFSILSLPVYAQSEDWTCTEVASIKNQNTVLVCGVATAATEGEARELALKRAKTEFELICESSADCRDFDKNIEPLRNSCARDQDGGYKCYRGLRYTILAQRTSPAEPPVAQVVEPRSDRPNSRPSTQSYTSRPFSVAVGRYALSVKQNDFVIRETRFTGAAIWLGYALTQNVGLRGGLYSASNTDNRSTGATPELKARGQELQLLIGNNLDRKGFRVYIGLGTFSESWEIAGTPHDRFSGSQFTFGLGYNWQKVTLEYSTAVRGNTGYQKSFSEGDPSNLVIQTTGVTLAARF